jgi:hypothetical protein
MNDVPVTNKQVAHPPINVLLPNGSTMQSTHTADLDLPFLPIAARRAHIFPNLASGSLISMGQFCDSDCKIVLDKKFIHIHHKGKLVLQGTRSPVTRLWHLHLPAFSAPSNTPPLSTTPSHCANAILPSGDLTSRIAFYHAALFSPTVSTWCKAIDSGFLTTWPELTSTQVRKHLPPSEATIKGHLNQQRANLRSTQPKSTPSSKPALPSSHRAYSATETDEDQYPTPLLDGKKTHEIYAAYQTATGQIYTDPTGRFITKSTSGNSDLLVVYCYDSNYIHAEPMKSKSGPEIRAAYERVFHLLTSRGLRPLLQTSTTNAPRN